MEHQFEIGDEFKINHSEIYKNTNVPNRYKCKYPDKTFIISGFSKSRQSVYYSDKRTSKKCKCSNCSYNNPMLGLGNKCIGIADIILVCSRLQRERDITLKKLFGK